MSGWTVPYVGFRQQYQEQQSDLLRTIDEVLTGGDLIMRQQMLDFETHVAEYVGTRYALGVSNCTDALHLSVRAAGLGAGDEVITVSHTFVATAAAIHHAGATPVLVDVGDDHNMDPDAFEAAITPRTRAVLPVHLNGRISDMRRIMEIAERHGLTVIEDAAQALGATFEGKGAGSFGVAGCFSFYPAKLLGALGDGGAVVTDSDEIRERVNLLRNHGRLPDGTIGEWSFNCRLDNVQAAILDVRLGWLDGWNRRRRAIAARYQAGLADLDALLLPPPPVEEGDYYDVFQNYEVEAEDRDALEAYLREQGVETMRPWGGKAIHQSPALGLSDTHLPRTDLLFDRVLMLPMFPELADEQVDYVVDRIHEFYR